MSLTLPTITPECAITIYVGSYDCPGTYVLCVGVLEHHLSPCSSK